MTCRECLTILSTLEDPRAEGLSAPIRHHLAGCPSCRARLAALRLVEEGKGLRVAPPPGLVQAVMERHRAAAAPRRRSVPVTRWAPFAAAAALALALLLPLDRRPPAGGNTEAGVARIHLTLEAPAAREVDVVGDWNGWNPKAQPMWRTDGRWEIVLELQRGRCYQYQFLVDGTTWIPDPNALARVDNGFGGVNSLLGS